MLLFSSLVSVFILYFTSVDLHRQLCGDHLLCTPTVEVYIKTQTYTVARQKKMALILFFL